MKELDRIIPEYAAFIEASPFAALATSGPEGLDCTPRGDLAGFVRIKNDRTLLMPDRRGNNRADSLKNIIRDPQGRAALPDTGLRHDAARQRPRRMSASTPSSAPRFTVEGKPARSVIVIDVETVYFQCARAIRRSDLWNPEKHVDQKSLPTPGSILEVTSQEAIDGDAYDREWPERARKTIDVVRGRRAGCNQGSRHLHRTSPKRDPQAHVTSPDVRRRISCVEQRPNPA